MARDLWEMICGEGLETVQSNLKNWLNETSWQGSGDDITVGILYRGNDERPGGNAACA